jgi:site-specific DNA-methyltransferase (adenine-specific)
MWTLHEGDCLEIMPSLPDKSIDMILCDLPYGTTACKWDTVIPFAPLWVQYERLIKDNGAIVLTASQPFTTALISSNMRLFKYELIWDKTFGRQPQLANVQPMKRHENILIFGKGRIIYNPQKTPLDRPYKSSGAGNNAGTENHHKLGLKKQAKVYTDKTPDSVLAFKPHSNSGIYHPTQKPVALFEYLIKTYTNPGDTILDNCAGSGTTAIAAEQSGRNSILIEREPKYCDIIRKRLHDYENARQEALF